MKSIFTTLLLLFTFISFSQDFSDKSQIEVTLNNYIDGFYQGDTLKLKESLQPRLYKFGYWKNKDTGEPVEQTEWHRIVLNNRLGEIAQQYLRKGSKVYIEGSLRTRKWTDNAGVEKYTTEEGIKEAGKQTATYEV